jgi:hypothetical protein
VKIIPYFFLIVLPVALFGQNDKNIDKYKDSIAHNIFRVIGAIDVPGRLAFQYEREIKRPFTFVLSGGASIDIQTFGDLYNSNNSKYQFDMGALASAEVRYYFTLNHRIKKQKPVHNFSAFYFSIEQFIASNPFIFINQKKSQGLAGSVQTFLNIGWQKQFQSLYFNIYIGPAIIQKTLSKQFPNTTSQRIHSGLAIGLSF